MAVHIQATGAAWHLFEVTGRPLSVGLVGLAQFIPMLLFTFPAGAVADRYDRRMVVLASVLLTTVNGAILAGLTWKGMATPALVYSLIAVHAVTRTFIGAADAPLVASLAEGDLFARAIAFGQIIRQSSIILGPAMAGVLHAVGGSTLVFGTASAFGFVGLYAFMVLRVPPVVSATQGPPAMQEMLGGVRFIAGHPVMLGAITLDATAVLFGGAVALTPSFATSVLRAGALESGFLRAAPGIGALIAALVLAMTGMPRRIGPTLLAAVAAFAGSIVMFGYSTTFPVALVALVCAGGFDMFNVVIRHTIVQLATPNEMRGRVTAANQLLIGASNELGEVESGLTAEWWGTPQAIRVGGFLSLGIVAVWAAMFPKLARADRIESVAVNQPGHASEGDGTDQKAPQGASTIKPED